MDIVVYSKPFFPRMGGLERNTLTLCLALLDGGNNVHLITETQSKAEKKYPFQIARTTNRFEMYKLLDRADLLIVNGNLSLRVIPLAFSKGVPYAIIYHNFLGYKRSENNFLDNLDNKIRWWFAHRARLNIFTNTYSKETVEVPPETAHVVLNPVDKILQEHYCKGSTLPDEHKAFLFAGRLIEGKGIFILLEALRLLDGKLNVKVNIAGEGHDETRFRKEINNFETIKINMLGRLRSSDLVNEYQNAKALIVPSTTHKEGNPLVIAESLYAGTPVIASDQPPMIESVGEAGIIVEQGSAKSLAQALIKIEHDDIFYKKICEKARERSNIFSYENYKRKINNIFSI